MGILWPYLRASSGICAILFLVLGLGSSQAQSVLSLALVSGVGVSSQHGLSLAALPYIINYECVQVG